MRNDPIMIAAFEGWSDAGNAATSLVEALIDSWDATPVGRLDEQEYYDFQVARPQIETTDDGDRKLVWPGTEIWTATTPRGRKALLLRGLEPSFNWQEFVAEIIFEATNASVGEFVVLGALLADVPHTRPFPLSISSSSPVTQREREIQQSQYQGPAGITSVLEIVAAEEGFATMQIWVSVPHYVADPPSPKASLSLARELSVVLGEDLDLSDFKDAAMEWEKGVNELTVENPDVAGYVSQLEELRDTADSPSASGDAIAAEFERYLRRRGDGPKP